MTDQKIVMTSEVQPLLPPVCVDRVCLSNQGVNNFVQYKFSHLPSKERQTITELSKMFLNQINYWQLETPSQRRQRVPSDDAAGYKSNYTR